MNPTNPRHPRSWAHRVIIGDAAGGDRDRRIPIGDRLAALLWSRKSWPQRIGQLIKLGSTLRKDEQR
jgi:hypothetical protein